MPVEAKFVEDKWRIVEISTQRLCRNEKGTPCDGGGHTSRKDAVAQATAINISESKRA